MPRVGKHITCIAYRKGDLTIQHTIKGYGEQFYSVRHIDGIYVGAKVDVVVNPYRAPDIDILMTNEHGEQVIHTVQPDQYDIFGQLAESPAIGEEIHAMPDSKIDQSRKRIMKQAYNAETQAEVDKAIKNVPLHTKVKSTQLHTLPNMKYLNIYHVLANKCRQKLAVVRLHQST